MNRFAEVCDAIGAATGKKEKVRLAAAYLASLDLEQASYAALFLCGLPLARHRETVLAVGASLLWRALTRVAAIQPEHGRELYLRHGDLGLVAAEVLPNRSALGPSVAATAAWFETLAAARGPSIKQARIEEMLSRVDAAVAKYLIKIITGDMRIGLKESQVEEAVAQAFGRDPEVVRRANMLTGDIGETLRLAATGRLAEARLRLLHPVGFMLASPVDSAEEAAVKFAGECMVEDKYDGIRAQAHKSGGRVKLFSRTSAEIVEFDELVPHLAAIEGDYVIDGEIAGWRDGYPLPFTTLQQRLGRKQPELWLPLEIPVRFVAFDLLYRDGALLLDEPLETRRGLLARLVPQGSASLQLARARRCGTAVEIHDAFDQAIQRGNEGVMIKDPAGPYAPGRRGRWWFKWKKPMATLDVVVTAVEYGHGKRRGLLSDYTFAVRSGERLVDIGKAYSGLTDEEIARYTQHFLEHTIEDQGFRRLVEPDVVIEVAFNNVQRSSRHSSGYALRFPRIVRLRSDKAPAEADTIERVAGLYDAQFRNSPPGG